MNTNIVIELYVYPLEQFTLKYKS